MNPPVRPSASILSEQPCNQSAAAGAKGAKKSNREHAAGDDMDGGAAPLEPNSKTSSRRLRRRELKSRLKRLNRAMEMRGLSPTRAEPPGGERCDAHGKISSTRRLEIAVEAAEADLDEDNAARARSMLLSAPQAPEETTPSVFEC